MSRQSELINKLRTSLDGTRVYADIDENGNDIVISLKSKNDISAITSFKGNIMECTLYVNGIIDLAKAIRRA